MILWFLLLHSFLAKAEKNWVSSGKPFRSYLSNHPFGWTITVFDVSSHNPQAGRHTSVFAFSNNTQRIGHHPPRTGALVWQINRVSVKP
jgi:hypothetical protein